MNKYFFRKRSNKLSIFTASLKFRSNFDSVHQFSVKFLGIEAVNILRLRNEISNVLQLGKSSQKRNKYLLQFSKLKVKWNLYFTLQTKVRELFSCQAEIFHKTAHLLMQMGASSFYFTNFVHKLFTLAK